MITALWSGLLAKSLESMLQLWEHHVNALPANDESGPASRLRSTAKAAWFFAGFKFLLMSICFQVFSMVLIEDLSLEVC